MKQRSYRQLPGKKPILINIIIPFIERLIEYVRQRAARTLDGDKMNSTPLISRHITEMLYAVPKLDSNTLWCAPDESALYL
jgi:hypothetical protein